MAATTKRAADGANNNQLWHEEEEEDLTSLLTPATALVLSKMKTRKNGRFTAYFSSSRLFHCFTEYNIIVDTYFSLCDLNIYLSAHPTITNIPDLTEEVSICTSVTLRRKG